MGKIDIIPYTDFTTWCIGYPVPADRSVEGRVVSTQLSTIQVSVLEIFLLHNAKVSIFDDMYLQLIGTWFQFLGYVDTRADKGTIDSAYLLAIQ